LLGKKRCVRLINKGKGLGGKVREIEGGGFGRDIEGELAVIFY